MTKDASDLNQLEERTSWTKTYFTARKRMGILSDKVQTLTDSLHKIKIFYNLEIWKNFPVVRWFYNNDNEDGIVYEVR